MTQELFDYEALVVGSGFGGAVTACRLAQAFRDTPDKKVCLLERGRRYLPDDLPVMPDTGRDSTRTPTPGADRILPDFARAFWAFGHGLWDVRDLGELAIGQAAGLGGGSLVYANVHLRAPASAFNAWPGYDKATLEASYDLAAYMLQVGTNPSPLKKSSALVAAAEKLQDRIPLTTFSPPLAIHFGGTGPNPFGHPQSGCDLRGECLLGCRSQSKNSLDVNYLHVAEENGLEVVTLAEVVGVEALKGGGFTVHYCDHLAGGAPRRLTTRYVFLCAGAINTTELLVRSKEERGLPVEGRRLGSGVRPNADEVAVVFDCDGVQEVDRGPTIDKSLLFHHGDDWLLVQDGGLPTHLEPWLGLYRSPLWLGRNAFRIRKDGDGDAMAEDPPRAALPFESVLELFSSLAGGAVAGSTPLVRTLGEAALGYAKGGNRLTELLSTPTGEWELLPPRVQKTLSNLRRRTLDRIARSALPTVDAVLQEASEDLAKSFGDLFENLENDQLSKERVAAWVLRIGVQLVWGSQIGLVGSMARTARDSALPDAGALAARVGDLMRWGLDYRLGDGHAAILLSMGRDSGNSWRLHLEHGVPKQGTRIEGEHTGTEAWVLASSRDELKLFGVTGEFDPEERLLAGGRPFAVGLQQTHGEWKPSAMVSKVDDGGAHDDSIRVTEMKLGKVPPSRLVASSERVGMKPPWEPTAQNLLLRELAAQLGGEMRANPAPSFFDRRLSVHVQGGCPMAAAPEDGVTDPGGRVYGCEGLYVMDAAAFPDSVGVNPSATIAAVAEHKIAEFARTELGAGTGPLPWEEHVERARAWADPRREMLDPLRDSQPGPAPRWRFGPVGIRFDEVMKGTWGPAAGPMSELRSELTVEIPNLEKFLAEGESPEDADPEEPLAMRMVVARGSVFVTGLPADEGSEPLPEIELPVTPGDSYLEFQVPHQQGTSARRELVYHLEFGDFGRRFALDGRKRLEENEPAQGLWEVWKDSTTLFFELTESRVPLGEGVLRVSLEDFLDTQLKSFAATGTEEDPIRELWALGTLGRFFFGHLVDVYLPGLHDMARTAAEAARKGHV